VFVLSCGIRVDNGLLPGGLPSESWYLGWKILVALHEANRPTGDCLRLTVLSSMVLAVLLITLDSKFLLTLTFFYIFISN
jgi:hypothetical protein